MANVKIKTIPIDAIIDIQVSGSYYQKIIQVFMDITAPLSPEEFTRITNKLKNNEQPADMMEVKIFTMLILILEIEQQAHKQNKVVEKEIDLPDEDEKPAEVTGS